MVVRSPVLTVVKFGAVWCGPCKFYDQAVQAVEPRFAGRVRFVSVDIDASPELAKRFGIKAVPTVLIMRAGTVLDRVTGGMGPQMLQATVQRHL